MLYVTGLLHLICYIFKFKQVVPASTLLAAVIAILPASALATKDSLAQLAQDVAELSSCCRSAEQLLESQAALPGLCDMAAVIAGKLRASASKAREEHTRMAKKVRFWMHLQPAMLSRQMAGQVVAAAASGQQAEMV